MIDQKNDDIRAALQIIIALGLPRAQHNERSALSLLALLNLMPDSLQRGAVSWLLRD